MRAPCSVVARAVIPFGPTSTSAPSARSAATWKSTGRRPIGSPPTSGTNPSPVWCSSGPSIRIGIRFSPVNASGTRGSTAFPTSIVISASDRPTWYPTDSSMAAVISTSPTSGTLRIVLGPSPSIAATMCLDTAFFDPRTRMSPRSGPDGSTCQAPAMQITVRAFHPARREPGPEPSSDPWDRWPGFWAGGEGARLGWPTVIPAPDIPGHTITGVLGTGGFATVYRSWQVAVGREVAVKVDSRVLLSERDQRRFFREVTAAGRLSGHPHVIDVYDAGTLGDGRPYLVMELCPAGSLNDELHRSGPMRAARVRGIGTGIADALAAAHAGGVLHRDIKPANILINRYGVVGLSDFGLASIVATSGEQSVTRDALTPA